MRVAALFTDYDGTIAPGDADRASSKVPPGLEKRLEELSDLIPLAVITSKDLGFVLPRTRRFAKAWACSAGLEIATADGRVWSHQGREGMQETLTEVKKMLPDGFVLEEKRSSQGMILGFCVDWTRTGLPDGELPERLAEFLRERGLCVDRTPGLTFLDAFAVSPDKGLALSRLKESLGVDGPVIYMGDSVLDNEAFAMSDISIGIDHGQQTGLLRCTFVIPYGCVERFLSMLIESNLEFSSEIVRSLRGAERDPRERRRECVVPETPEAAPVGGMEQHDDDS